jgi:phosphoglucomutase
MMKLMTRMTSPLAGKPAPLSILIDVPKLVSAYYTEVPDPAVLTQRVTFGTSGHRGSSLLTTFNEWHILAITQAICLFRKLKNIDGPLFIGIDTHALSVPAFASALEVLAANEVTVMIAKDDEYTPTPVISHAILTYNQQRTAGLADGIVITPSHNPPSNGGFKYNPPNGGPANIDVTTWIENKANELLEHKLEQVKRISYEHALTATTTHRHDYLNHYIKDLSNVIDMEIIRSSNLHIGVDPLGGAGVHYWQPIANYYHLNLTVTNQLIDPTFRFMPVDWDGQIRMNPASPYSMMNVLAKKDQFDLMLACDTDHDRHGIITKNAGLLAPNHYFSVAVDYLFQDRPAWAKTKMVAKTVVTTQMLNHVAQKIGCALDEVPVGFKWFVEGLYDGSLGFCCEESAGASLSRLDGSVWTTDKDGIAAALLAAEITASSGRDIGESYHTLEQEFGVIYGEHMNVTATAEQKLILQNLTAADITCQELAGDKITAILTTAPGNDAPIGGIKVISDGGWCVVRPSGTEAIYEIYAESYHDASHLQRILTEAQTIVTYAFKQSSTMENNDHGK